MTGPTPAYTAVDHARPARTDGAVQRIREVQENGFTFELTQNNRYAIIRDCRYIFAQRGEPVSDALEERPDSAYTIEGREYRQYQIRRWLLKDCLHTAEEIINNLPGELASAREQPPDVRDDQALFSRIRIGNRNRLFGRSDEENVTLAQNFTGPKNHEAAPGLNEAFVIIATQSEVENGVTQRASPYHAGAVVAVDDADRIILEEWDQRGWSSRGRAAIYRVGDQARSFHAVWGGAGRYFGSREPITVVVGRAANPGRLSRRQPPLPTNTFGTAPDVDLQWGPSPASSASGSDTEQQ